MGVYYKIVCDEKKESIDPGEINDLGIKASSIANPTHPFGPLVIFASLHRWNQLPIRLVNDTGDDDGYFRYDNVTEYIIEEYNKVYDTNLVFTGL
jgi:hypothetical protein